MAPSVLHLTVTVCLLHISLCHGLFERWYVVPPLGITTVFDVETNWTVAFSAVHQPAAMKEEAQIPDLFEGYLVVAHPLNACGKLDPPPEAIDQTRIHSRNAWLKVENSKTVDKIQPKRKEAKTTDEDRIVNTRNWILIADKTYCSYQSKIQYAHQAGYKALIIHNVGSNKTEVIGYSEEHFDLLIPTYFVGEYDGRLLRRNFSYNTAKDSYLIRIESQTAFYFNVVMYLVWAFFTLLMFVIFICALRPCYYCMVQPWWKKRREQRKRKLLLETVAALPIVEWKHEHHEKFETCVICLESYTEGDLLRVLKCSHGFHMVCIDAWLLKVRRNCPSCKSNLMSSRCWSEFSDSDISEGNYWTDMGYEPHPSPQIPFSRRQNGSELGIGTPSRSMSSRNRRSDMSLSSARSTSTLASNYSTALSMDGDTTSLSGDTSPSSASCMVVIHPGPPPPRASDTETESDSDN